MTIIKCKCGKEIWLDDLTASLIKGLSIYHNSNEDSILMVWGPNLGPVHIARLVVQVPDGVEPDHIDGNKHNNLPANLRLATRSQNAMNRPKQANNTSGYKGVSWHKRSAKWGAAIQVNGKQKHLGLFESVIDAASAYNEAAEKYHGSFANLNKL